MFSSNHWNSPYFWQWIILIVKEHFCNPLSKLNTLFEIVSSISKKYQSNDNTLNYKSSSRNSKYPSNTSNSLTSATSNPYYNSQQYSYTSTPASDHLNLNVNVNVNLLPTQHQNSLTPPVVSSSVPPSSAPIGASSVPGAAGAAGHQVPAHHQYYQHYQNQCHQSSAAAAAAGSVYHAGHPAGLSSYTSSFFKLRYTKFARF